MLVSKGFEVHGVKSDNNVPFVMPTGLFLCSLFLLYCGPAWVCILDVGLSVDLAISSEFCSKVAIEFKGPYTGRLW